MDRVNAERGTAINGRCYVHAAAWATINAMVLRDTYRAGAIEPDARIYTQLDANYNVTALIGYKAGTGTWGVVQRYVYTPYGVPTVLNANRGARSNIRDPSHRVAGPTMNGWGYCGREDPITGLYDFRHRDYSPTLGNWIEQDPAGYINGGNTYQFVMGQPAEAVDKNGTVAAPSASRGNFFHRWGQVILEGGAYGATGGAATVCVMSGPEDLPGIGLGAATGGVIGGAGGAVGYPIVRGIEWLWGQL